MVDTPLRFGSRDHLAKDGKMVSTPATGSSSGEHIGVGGLCGLECFEHLDDVPAAVGVHTPPPAEAAIDANHALLETDLVVLPHIAVIRTVANVDKLHTEHSFGSHSHCHTDLDADFTRAGLRMFPHIDGVASSPKPICKAAGLRLGRLPNAERETGFAVQNLVTLHRLHLISLCSHAST